jgi:flagellar motor switch protein FliN/FliY
LSRLEAGLGDRDVMKLATTANVGSNDRAPMSRARERTPDVNRWVAMLDAELRADDSPAVEVTFEFGRCTLDSPSNLQIGDSVPLDQLADEPLDVLADGRPIARGELVVVEGQLGVRIVELLMLLVAWFAIGIPTIFADERTPSTLFDDEPPELLETPFRLARNSRSDSAEPPWSNENQPSTARRQDSRVASSTPLTPRSAKSDGSETVPSRIGWSATLWPLLFIVGLIVVGARWLQSRSTNTARVLPSEVFEILGRKVIDTRTAVVLARSGTRVLLLSLSPHGLQTLAEITDPVEADCLAGLCHATQRDQSLVETFRSLLHKPKSPRPRNSSSLEDRLAARQTIGAPPVFSPEVRP